MQIISNTSSSSVFTNGNPETTYANGTNFQNEEYVTVLGYQML
jgi:hypothetical protein